MLSDEPPRLSPYGGFDGVYPELKPVLSVVEVKGLDDVWWGGAFPLPRLSPNSGYKKPRTVSGVLLLNGDSRLRGNDNCAVSIALTVYFLLSTN